MRSVSFKKTHLNFRPLCVHSFDHASLFKGRKRTFVLVLKSVEDFTQTQNGFRLRSDLGLSQKALHLCFKRYTGGRNTKWSLSSREALFSLSQVSLFSSKKQIKRDSGNRLQILFEAFFLPRERERGKRKKASVLCVSFNSKYVSLECKYAT